MNHQIYVGSTPQVPKTVCVLSAVAVVTHAKASPPAAITPSLSGKTVAPLGSSHESIISFHPSCEDAVFCDGLSSHRVFRQSPGRKKSSICSYSQTSCETMNHAEWPPATQFIQASSKPTHAGLSLPPPPPPLLFFFFFLSFFFF